jgi:hypothetical protein
VASIDEEVGCRYQQESNTGHRPDGRREEHAGNDTTAAADPLQRVPLPQASAMTGIDVPIDCRTIANLYVCVYETLSARCRKDCQNRANTAFTERTTRQVRLGPARTENSTKMSLPIG